MEVAERQRIRELAEKLTRECEPLGLFNDRLACNERILRAELEGAKVMASDAKELGDLTAEEFAYKCFPLNDAYDPHDQNAKLRAELLHRLAPDKETRLVRGYGEAPAEICECASPYLGCQPVDSPPKCERCGGKLAVSRLAPPPAQTRPIDGKFGIDGQKIVNLVSGEEIPRDEPLFLLRARDRHALELLQNYIGICAEDCNELHLAGGRQVYEKFATFAMEHPERIKQPGVTRHLKLEPEAPPAQDVLQLAAAQAALLKINGLSSTSPCTESTLVMIHVTSAQPLSALREFVESLLPRELNDLEWNSCLAEIRANLAKTLEPKP